MSIFDEKESCYLHPWRWYRLMGVRIQSLEIGDGYWGRDGMHSQLQLTASRFLAETGIRNVSGIADVFRLMLSCSNSAQIHDEATCSSLSLGKGFKYEVRASMFL